LEIVYTVVGAAVVKPSTVSRTNEQIEQFIMATGTRQHVRD